jgi:hypothetical protein
MVSGYTKSKEGVAAYSKLGLPYPDEVFEELYEKWLKETSADELSKYTHHKEKEVTQIVRVRAGDGKEYLLYSFAHCRLDSALNVRDWWLPNIGKYPIPTPRYETTTITFGKQQRRIAEVISVEAAYSIPFSPKNLDKIRDIGLEAGGKVQYLVEIPNGLKTSIATYHDLREEEDFDVLVHFGKIPTSKQREAWLEGSGREKDLERLEQVQRSRENRR